MAYGLLVSYGGYPYTLTALFPDNGLASLAAVLRSEGHACQILDFNTPALMGRLVDDQDRETLARLLPVIQSKSGAKAVSTLVEVARRVEARNGITAEEIALALVRRCEAEAVDFIGFKLWSGDGFEASVKIAAILRDRVPRVKLFAGGPAVHFSGQMVPREAPMFDAVINGDGEEAIVELARFVEGTRPLEGVPNLVKGDSRGVCNAVQSDLSTLPLPDYHPDVYPAMEEGGKIKLLCVDESRGCPMRCAFCINPSIGGRRWRVRSAEAITAQIRAFKQQWKSRGLRLTGSYCPPKLARGICKAIVAEGLDVQFGLYLHATGADHELLSELREAGCFGVFYGVESGSGEILKDAINKSAGVETLLDVVDATVNAGLFTCGSFIFPAPFETEESARQTRQFIEDAFVGRSNTSVIVNFPGLIPGTQWWDERVKFGFQLDVSDDAYRRTILRYKIRHLLPASMWDPLPYTLNGRSHAEVCSESSSFRKWVQGQGIVANLPDHDAMLGSLLGYTPRGTQELLMRIFFTGDGESLQRFTDQSNEALCS